MHQTYDQREALHEARLAGGPIHILDVPEVWVLLWSQSQNALHIETLGDMQRANLDAFAEDRRMDYVMLAIGNRAAVDAAADDVRPHIHARAESRARAAI